VAGIKKELKDFIKLQVETFISYLFSFDFGRLSTDVHLASKLGFATFLEVAVNTALSWWIEA